MLKPTGPQPVELLILGAGWTSTFLIPLLTRLNISHAATTTTGRDGTIPYRFDPESTSTDQYRTLPSAKTVLVTFPLKGTGQSKHITSLYRSVHGEDNGWIQLGSTGIYKDSKDWTTRNSPYEKSSERAVAEDELMDVVGGCVLNLSGLYGGQRDPRHWLTRIFKDKESVRSKGAVHLVHGQDVARAIVGCRRYWSHVKGQRWIVTDLRVYDWWDLAMSWGGEDLGELEKLDEQRDLGTDAAEKRQKLEENGRIARWVGECMVEEDVKALPRETSMVGRRLDAREFWNTIHAWPSVGRVG